MKYLLSFLICLLLCFTFNQEAKAIFTLGGSTITQTGTNGDLSGLENIAGVTSIIEDTGGISYITYYIGDLQLDVQGTLSIDPEREHLIIGDGAPNNSLLISSGGTLNLGRIVSENASTRPSFGRGITILKDNTGCCSNGAFRVEGTFNMNGGELFAGAVINWQAGSTINIESGRILSTLANERIRDYCSNLTINGLTLSGIAFDMFRAPISIEGLEYYDSANQTSRIQLVSTGSGGTDDEVEFKNYPARKGTSDFDAWKNADLKITNSELGTDLSTVAGGGSNQNIGRVYQEVKLTISDSSGSAIEGSHYIIRDYDNGNRTSKTVRSGTTYDFTDDQLYDGITDVNGETSVFEVLTAHIYEVGDTETYDRRSKNDDTTDTFDIHLWSYEHSYAVITEQLKGIGTKEIDWPLFDDTDITETDNATVLSYTQIDNLDELYDYAKAWKTDGNGNLEIPAIDELLISTAGTQLVLPDTWNLDIIADAVPVFEVFNGQNLIRIKSAALSAGNKFSSISTVNGEITLVNGASLSGVSYTSESGSNSSVTVSSLTSSNVLLYNKTSDATIDYQTSQTGTYAYNIDPAADTNYSVKVRRAGYTEAELDFDPSGGGAFSLAGSLSQRLSLSGANLYTGVGNDANVSFDWSNKLILLQGAVTYEAQELFDITQRAQITENGMKLDPIMDFDGNSNILLLDGWQIKNGDALTPTVQAFVATDDTRDIIATNGSVQVREVANANAFKQDQIITLSNQLSTMLEKIQGSSYDDNNGTYLNANGTLLKITGNGFINGDHSLDSIIDKMHEQGILNTNTIKDIIH